MASGVYSAGNYYTRASSLQAMPLTLAGWVYRTDELLGGSIVSLSADSGSIYSRVYGWTIAASSGSWVARQQRYNSRGDASISQGGSSDRNKWCLVVGTFTSNTYRDVYYYNQSTLQTVNNTTEIVIDFGPQDRMTIGTVILANGSQMSDVLNAYVCHVAAWNIVLSSDDIATLCTKLPTCVQPANLVYYAPMDSGNKEGDGDLVDLVSGTWTEVGTVNDYTQYDLLECGRKFGPALLTS